MQKMSTVALRQAFLDYFQQHKHEKVASSALVPENDPTLLFTNAGMNQFKDVFLGQETRAYSRAVSSQRCVRAGGKHNDLDNVGYTARHHTFFEMLGNFSFGDYFKEDAIRMAWEFLTQTLGLPASKLWVTVYEEDLEAEQIWLEKIGVDPARLSRIGAKDNFWSMGDTGPCGPCSEIFFDHGEHIAGGPPGTPEEDGDRYIEIWNLVFMQYNRHQDGKMVPLPKPSVDTGMGLERIAAILQGVHSNYEIDLFQALIGQIAKTLNVDDSNHPSLRVIADHIRSCAFLIADGVMPSNEGRGYVLRRIIRRAVRHGNKLGASQAFFYSLVDALVEAMGDAADVVAQRASFIKKALQAEEEQFARTLDRGMALLNEAIKNLGAAKVLPGATVFKLYDTYGFPMDLTADVCRERHLSVDEASFEVAMAEQKARASAASQFDKDYNDQVQIDASTSFEGYEHLQLEGEVTALYYEQEATTSVAAGQKVWVVLDRTAFYPESGGQVGDAGKLQGEGVAITITDTQKVGAAIVHQGHVTQGEVHIGQRLLGQVNAQARLATTLHHSATHVLHAALREVLGTHVQQKGSLVRSDLLRFDFSHFEALTPQQLAAVEQRVNQEIAQAHQVETNLMNIEAAKQAGAMALFGEKYGDEVRVIRMGAFSVELCGGTHVANSADLKVVKITSERGIAAGVRRIEAVAAKAAHVYCEKQLQDLDAQLTQSLHRFEALKDQTRVLAKTLEQEPLFAEIDLQRPQPHLEQAEDASLIPAFAKAKLDFDKQEHNLQGAIKQQERTLKQLNDKQAAAAGSALVDAAVEVAGVPLLVHKLENTEAKALRGLVDELKQKLGSGVIVLGMADGNKVNLIVGVTADLTARCKAGDLVRQMAQTVGGKGGGRPDMAQAGGQAPEKLDEALAQAEPWLVACLADS